jgi:hypothetical protein
MLTNIILYFSVSILIALVFKRSFTDKDVNSTGKIILIVACLLWPILLLIYIIVLLILLLQFIVLNIQEECFK